MNVFVIVEGLPYLLANGKTYAVRWNEEGFTVGAEVELASVPTRTVSEFTVKAKCAVLDSIGDTENEQSEPENNPDEEGQNTPPENEQSEPENTEKGIDEMTLAELKEYAKTHDIALNGARTKDAIIEVIKAAAE